MHEILIITSYHKKWENSLQKYSKQMLRATLDIGLSCPLECEKNKYASIFKWRTKFLWVDLPHCIRTRSLAWYQVKEEQFWVWNVKQVCRVTIEIAINRPGRHHRLFCQVSRKSDIYGRESIQSRKCVTPIAIIFCQYYILSSED